MEKQTVLILDFGGQYNQLIARRVRECSVYCEVHPYNKLCVSEIREMAPAGIIFTGGPNSVYADGAPRVDKELLRGPADDLCAGRQGFFRRSTGIWENGNRI